MTTGLIGPRTSPDGAAPSTEPSGSQAPLAVPVRRRRRPAVMLAAVMLAAAGGGIAATTAAAAGHRVPVLALAHDVPMGAVLSSGDLRVAHVASDPALHPIGAGDRGRVIGRHAAMTLAAGTLLTSSMLTDAFAPGPGQALVAVPLKPGQLPARPLAPGDHVLAIAGADAGVDGGSPAGGGPAEQVVVADVGRATADGVTVIDVVVPSTDAATLARQAAAGRIALVLLGPAGS